MAVLMVDNVGYNLRIYSNIYAVSFFAHVFFSMMGDFDTTTPKYMVGIIYAFHFQFLNIIPNMIQFWIPRNMMIIIFFLKLPVL